MENKKIVEALQKIAPLSLSAEWDNCGFLVGKINAQSHKILLCLDITSKVIKEAIDQKISFIVCHHPIIFEPQKSITDQTTSGKLLLELIENGIAVFACHTCLDRAKEGINAYLGGLFDFGNIEVNDSCPDIIFGQLDCKLDELKGVVEKKLGAKTKIVCQDLNTTISKAAVISGAGGGKTEYIDQSMALGAQVLITAEIKHHVALYALEKGFNMIEYSHYQSEHSYLGELQRLLKRELNQVQIIVAQSETNPIM